MMQASNVTNMKQLKNVGPVQYWNLSVSPFFAKEFTGTYRYIHFIFCDTSTHYKSNPTCIMHSMFFLAHTLYVTILMFFYLRPSVRPSRFTKGFIPPLFMNIN